MGCAVASQVGPGGPLSQLLVRHTRTHTIDGPSDDVDALLAAAVAKAGVPRDAAWLSYGGRVLRSGRTLGSYGVAAGATVHLAVRGRGGAPKMRMHGASSSSSSLSLARQDTARAMVSYRADTSRASAGVASSAAPSSAPAPLLPEKIRRSLTALDDRLVEALERGDIRLLSSEWLLAQPKGARIKRR